MLRAARVNAASEVLIFIFVLHYNQWELSLFESRRVAYQSNARRVPNFVPSFFCELRIVCHLNGFGDWNKRLDSHPKIPVGTLQRSPYGLLSRFPRDSTCVQLRSLNSNGNAPLMAARSTPTALVAWAFLFSIHPPTGGNL